MPDAEMPDTEMPDTEMTGAEMPEADYPSEPWHLTGHGYVSVWPVPVRSLPTLPDGVLPATMFDNAIVVTAFVDYLPEGLLSYRELLAAVLVRRGRGIGLSITHIWVDSEASKAGARAMWGIPKEIAEFRVTHGRTFSGSAGNPDGPIASATYVRRTGSLLLPFPLRGVTVQALDGKIAETPIQARGPVRWAKATWQVDRNGPLAWLPDRKPLVSLAATDFRMSFGHAGSVGPTPPDHSISCTSHPTHTNAARCATQP